MNELQNQMCQVARLADGISNFILLHMLIDHNATGCDRFNVVICDLNQFDDVA